MLPRLYPIVDAELLAARGLPLETYARSLREAGVCFVQYRDKLGSDAEVCSAVRSLRAIFPAGECTLLLNDRVALVGAAQADGVHLGQGDMPAHEARALLGPELLLGLSTHSAEQVRAADATSADYLAIGPVYATRSKANPDPVVGLAGVAAARSLTAKPLVAIGGITRGNCRPVRAAGADAVAVISGLLPRAGESTEAIVREFLVDLA